MVLLGLTGVRGELHTWEDGELSGEGRDYGFALAPDITTGLLSNFTKIDQKNIARHLRRLEDRNYIVQEHEDRHIADVRWNVNTAGIKRSILMKEDWVKVPKAVLCDASLSSTAKHAYLALCHLNYTLSSAELRANRKLRTNFPVSDSLLGEVMGCGRAAARRYKAELRQARLITDGEGKPYKGIPQMQFVPPAVRYAYNPRVLRSGVRGEPLYVPLPRDVIERQYERWQTDGEFNHIRVGDEL